MRQAIQLGIDVVQLGREGIRLSSRVAVHFVRQRQVEIGWQFQIVLRHVGDYRRLDRRQIFHAVVQIQQEVIFSQRGRRWFGAEIHVQIEVRQIVEIVFHLGLFLQHRGEAQIVFGRKRVELDRRFWLDHWRRIDRGDVVEIVQAQIEGCVQIVSGWLRRCRLVLQQFLDVLRVQLGSDGGSRQPTGSDHGHGREAAFQRFDLGEVVAIGHQLTLLRDERIPIALLAIDFHQLQAQIAALRLKADALFQQRGGLIQATGIDVRLCLVEHVIRAFTGRGHQRCGNRRGHHHRSNDWRWSWRRCRSWRIEFDAGRWGFEAREAAFRQILLSGELLLFSQSAGHAQMLFGFLLGFATTRQQQQQKQQNHRTAADQAEQDRIGQQFIEGFVVIGGSRRGFDHRLDDWLNRGFRWRRDGRLWSR